MICFWAKKKRIRIGTMLKVEAAINKVVCVEAS